MDRLQQEIEQKRAQVVEAEKGVRAADKRAADARRVLELRKAELSAFERAASLRPTPIESSGTIAGTFVGDAGVRKGGRQPGAIALGWRKVLAALVASGNEFTAVPALCLLAESHSMPHDPRSVRERFRKFRDLGHVQDQDGKYRVTGSAIKRFELLDKEKAPPTFVDGASNSSGVSAPA